MKCFSCLFNLTYSTLPSDSPTKNCSACGTTIHSNKGKFYNCNNCKATVICDSCRLCPSGHQLQKVLFLNGKGENLYSSNKYNCDCCYTTKAVGPTGVWHCNLCDWDACDSCIK